MGKDFKPIEVELKKDKHYYWCQCGASKNQPFCDGSHEGYFCEPILVTVPEDTKKHLCTCKQSGNKPYCDGTHKTLNKE
jgi:CDGSH-type Zn-finger protein